MPNKYNIKNFFWISFRGKEIEEFLTHLAVKENATVPLRANFL
jgi:hypothetical protein